MYGYPLEIEQDELEKEKLEKEMEKEEMEKEDKGIDNSTVKTVKKPYIKPVFIIIGSVVCFVALIDMIVLFAIPYQRIQTNKKKLPNAKFEKPDEFIIIVHFALHSLIILIGVLIILLGFRGYRSIDQHCVLVFLYIIGFITLLFWLYEICTGLIGTSDIGPRMTIDELIYMISRNPPINFAFIYSHCESFNDDTYYSNNGITFPMKTNLTSTIYNFTNTPEMFYFIIEQKVNMSIELKNYYNNIFVEAHSCDQDAMQKVEYYPVIQDEYIVVKEKMPSYLSKGTRIASFLFGVGLFYELSTKSIPYITYVQQSNADIVQGIKYDQIFTSDTCNFYGKCTHSHKPKP